MIANTDEQLTEIEALGFENWLWQKFLWEQVKNEVSRTESGIVEIAVREGQIHEISVREP